ncbi:unnamed protein product [Lathyrus sativus]|nr:unnamed protein product [Lathyrus sativus]
MNFLSYNVCGLSSFLKRKQLGSLIRKDCFDVCLLQERKLSQLSAISVFELWGGTNVEWTFKPFIGDSGGMLLLWKQGFFPSCFSFTGEGFVGVGGFWKNSLVYVVNVYSSCFYAKKRSLWRYLEEIEKRFLVEGWILVDDFNTVR